MELSKIEFLGLDRVLRRGSGEILAERDGALLIRDRVSGAYMLACGDAESGMALLERHIAQDCALLMVSNRALGDAAFARFGFSEKLECYQAAYFGEKPSRETALTVREAGPDDLPTLIEAYRLISPEELEQVVKRGSVLLGYDGERLVGFIGEHLEGSMGLLYVFPEYRRRGFGAALEAQMIARTMEQGFVPFGQVEKDNLTSLALQEKMGMTRSDELIVWMWR